MFSRSRVLKVSSGLDDIGGIQWELVGTLFLSWLVVYGCIFKGVHSSGKVVYFTATFPYIMLTILLIRGITLPGAINGLIFYIKPDFTKLAQPQVRKFSSPGGFKNYFGKWFVFQVCLSLTTSPKALLTLPVTCINNIFFIPRCGLMLVLKCSTPMPAPLEAW